MAQAGTNRWRLRLKLSWVLAAMLALGCTSGERDSGEDVLLSFASTPCSGNARTPAPEAQCVAWQLDAGGTLQLEFAAVRAGCIDEELLMEIPWDPSAVVSTPGHLELAVVWPFEGANACGSCLYDFTFEVEVPEWDDMLSVELETRSCLDCSPDTRSFSLPKPAAPDRQQICQPE